MSELASQVALLLEDAAAAYEGTPAAVDVQALSARFREPLRIALAGRVKAGKSTLLNALVGERLAPTDAGECTRVTTWYQEGTRYQAWLDVEPGAAPNGESTELPTNGSPGQVRLETAQFTREDGHLDVSLDPYALDDIRRIVVSWPATALRSMTLIDTPGVGSLTLDAQLRAAATMQGDGAETADAVLYLLRHRHPNDARFLEGFADRTAIGNPVNSIGVLSRADEVAGCRPDSMEVAKRVVARYEADPSVRRLCRSMVPVAGLLAETAATLTESEYRMLVRLAGAQPDVLDGLLLSADRVVGDAIVALSIDERRQLLYRLGMYGLRLSIDLIVDGSVSTTRELADRLREASGIDALLELIQQRFLPRSDVLKARAALAGLDRVLRIHGGTPAATLALASEQLQAGAHELIELRLLGAAWSGELGFDEATLAELERIVMPGSRHQRLGLGPDVDEADLEEAVVRTGEEWRRRSEHPFSTPTQADAARTVVRTLEWLLVPNASPT